MAQEQLILPDRAPISLDPNQDPLARLRDIHLPADVPFWPPAPGWWILAGLVLLVVLIAAFLEWRRRQTLAYRALKELDGLARRDGANAQALAADAAVLMRRILLSAGAKGAAPEAASFTGAAWQQFLCSGPAALPEEVGRLVALAPYLPPPTPDDPATTSPAAREAVLRAVRLWIRGNA